MFDHVKFGVSDYAASKAFFLQALAPLGVQVGGEGAPGYGVELCTAARASLYQRNERAWQQGCPQLTSGGSAATRHTRLGP